MTTVNEAKVKVNGSWVSLIPDATTSSKGIVQVGDGLSVSDGVISVSSGSTTITTCTESSTVLMSIAHGYAGANTFSMTILPMIKNNKYTGTIRAWYSGTVDFCNLQFITSTGCSDVSLSTTSTVYTLPSNTVMCVLYGNSPLDSRWPYTLNVGFTMS